MPHIRIVREVTDPGARGPSRGMYALQHAIKAANIPWLHVGGHLRQGDIPWIWLYKDAALALQFEEWGWNYILGPNVFFSDSHRPGQHEYERRLLDGENCILQFTESEWYASLIQSCCNHNEAPIHIWSYPIDPQPEGPLNPDFEVLIYWKDRNLGREALRVQKKWEGKCAGVVYGHYHRDGMLECARRSRACLYLSSDDRGPLAAAEIALAGCPLVGIERGCPWVLTPGIGVEVQHFGFPGLFEAIEKAQAMDRNQVRATALERFATARTVEIIRKSLEPIAKG